MSTQPADERPEDVREEWKHVVLHFDDPRLLRARDDYPNPFDLAEAQSKARGPRGEAVRKERAERIAQPYKGITTDGTALEDLFEIADEGFEPGPAVAAAKTFLALLSDRERQKVTHSVDAPEWRQWFNGGAPLAELGLWLDWATPQAREAAMGIIRACFSDEGYIKTARCRSANLFLGELYAMPHQLGEWTYQFLLFGEPSLTEPWGWNLYGHHLALNCLVMGRQLVVSPTFLGAEPTIIDRGPGNRFTLFDEEAAGGLELIRSLDPSLRNQAVIYEEMNDPTMPPGRVAPLDERHLGGSFHDNRVIPYEGVSAKEFSSAQREVLLRVAENFVSYLPEGPRAARLAQMAAHLDDTWWSWIGGTGDADPFYYRVQSPVIMLEYDNHFGSFLANKEPAKYHVHTIVRTPNGNDYGKDLLRQHYERQHQDGGHTHSHEGHVHTHAHGDHEHTH
jgi:hypothetical protein